ncbi:MAG: tetratricopeptide repeat protein [Proteobacteria bacterium]|nr:tetratricopeptide repeat protein [Pseudomonadota bacterium]
MERKRSIISAAALTWLALAMTITAAGTSGWVPMVMAARTGPPVDITYQAAFQRSYISAATGDFDEAIKPILALHNQSKYRQDYLIALRLGWLYYRQGGTSRAIQFYSQATRLRPQAIEPWLGLLLPLFAAGRYQQAIRVGEYILARDRFNYIALAKVARSYYVLKRYDKAAEYYAKVLDLYPGDAQMRAGLAWSYLRSGQKAKALTQFRLVLMVDPSYFAQLGYAQALK